MYTLGICLYNWAIRIAALKNRKARLMLDGRRLTMPLLHNLRKPEERWIWVHAASLGEFEQGRPLIERIRTEHPELKIALTFYSPSGYEVRKNYNGADLVAYLPADTPRAMRRFIDALNPELAVIVKYEFWRNMLRELRRRNIPVILISAIFRPGQLFFKPWGGWYRKALRCFSHMYVQDEGSRKLLESIGLRNVTVAGDTRFDRVTDIMKGTHEIPALDAFTAGGTRFTIVFGSSWSADEEIYFPWLRKHQGGVKAVIAPHEFDTARLEKMRTLLSPMRTLLLSEVEKNPSAATDADVLIIDCFGLLSSAYRYGSMAYVGGGFGTGIHNINEAAVYGIPVVFGPRHQKFLEAGELINAGGGFSISEPEEFNRLMDGAGKDKGLTDPERRNRAGDAAGAYIRSKLGATDQIYSTLHL